MKLCPHINSDYAGGIGKLYTVKMCDPSVEYVREMRGLLGSKALIVIRWVEDWMTLDAPETAAQAWYSRHAGQLAEMAKGGPTVFEGYNEPNDGNVDLDVRFELTRIDLLHKAGLRAGLFSVCDGAFDTPELAEDKKRNSWAKAVPVLAQMLPGDFVCVHEYGRLPQKPTEDPNYPYHIGRITKVPELRGYPILITECGLDSIKGAAKGWKKQTGDFGQYLAWLRDLAAFYEPMQNVYAAFPFTLGKGWDDFSFNGYWQHIMAESGYGVAPGSMPAPPGTLPTPQPPVVTWPDRNSVRTAVWLHLWPDGIESRPTWALQTEARRCGYIVPLTAEFDLDGTRLQAYQDKAGVVRVVMAKIGAWDKLAVMTFYPGELL